MQVKWEPSDVRAGRRVWRDMECMIGADPHDYRAPSVIIVLETGRVMTIGTKDEVAAYLTEHEYRPTKEK